MARPETRILKIEESVLNWAEGSRNPINGEKKKMKFGTSSMSSIISLEVSSDMRIPLNRKKFR
jgi:hypothetical protein